MLFRETICQISFFLSSGIRITSAKSVSHLGVFLLGVGRAWGTCVHAEPLQLQGRALCAFQMGVVVFAASLGKQNCSA